MADRFHLIVGSFVESFEPRFAEYVECLEKNLACEAIDTVHLMVEEPATVYKTKLEENGGQSARRLRELLDHPKIHRFDLTHRMNFQDAFRYANASLEPGTLVLLANSDIYFDETLADLGRCSWANTLACISRYNYGEPEGKRFTTGYDAWAFRAPLQEFRCDWPLGTGRCDLRLNHEAYAAKLRLVNPCFSIRATHLHGSAMRRRQQNNMGQERHVPPSRLIEKKSLPESVETVSELEPFSIRDLQYDMPHDRSPAMPPPRRGMARLLVVDRLKKTIEQRALVDLPEIIGDREFVVNVSARRPSRIQLYTKGGKTVTAFLIHQKADPEWLALIRGFHQHIKAGAELHTEAGFQATIDSIEDNGLRILRFEEPLDLDLDAAMTYPPYVVPPTEENAELYESPWAERPGSFLASTTTVQIDEDTAGRLNVRRVVLHSETGPLATLTHGDVSRFGILPEQYEIIDKPSKGCVVAGAGALRAVEAYAKSGDLSGLASTTFHPGCSFELAGGLLFTLQGQMSPSLLALAAFVGIELAVKIIAEAKDTGFRFLDYGDLILAI